MLPDPISIPPSVLVAIAVQAFWLVWTAINFLRRNDDLPVVVAVFLAYCGSYRFLANCFGFTNWVDLGAMFGGSVSLEHAGSALMLIAFGQSALLISYQILQNKMVVFQQELLPGFLSSRLRLLLVILTCTGLPLILWSRQYTGRQAEAGMSMAFEISSYTQQFPMMALALAVFAFLAWRFGVLRNGGEKIACFILLLVIGYLTFGPTGRFMFLGWIIGGSYIFSTFWFGRKRMLVLLGSAVAALALFGIAGAMRYEQESGTFSASLDRTAAAEDANMLDGLVLLMQVYPKQLPFQYGMGHFEILERPIPRALWPGKPVGGYMNKLGIFNAGSSGTTGISPTLFGSFYTEGGWGAVFILSLIYGWAFARIVSYSCELRPLFGVLIRACLLGGIIPLLRGGDLPGIYAWLGMAFWPVFLFLFWNREYLRSSLVKATGDTGSRKRNRKKRARETGEHAAPYSVAAAESRRLKIDSDKAGGSTES